MGKILFAQEMYFPLQSTQCLSAYLKDAGHETDVAIGTPEAIVKYISAAKPSLIAFSVLTAYRNHMLDTAAKIRQAGITIPIIAGGYDITFMPQILEHSALDAICLGEGGEPIVELANALEEGKNLQDLEIGNLHIKGSNGEIKKNPMRYWLMDYDTVPFDDRDLYYDKDPYFGTIPFMQILAGRGCPYPCTYCFNHGYKKIHTDEGMKGREYTTFRSVDVVIKELVFLAKKYKFRDFFFNDSTMTYNKRWIIEFCKKYKEAGIKHTFSINGVIPELTEEVCEALASTKKCRLIRFGLETGNEEFRIKTLRKNVKDQQLIEVTDRLSHYGLRYSMQMMLGLPGESLEYAWETIDMARTISYRNSAHGINIFKPFPGLEINNIGLELGEYQASDVVAPGSVPPPTWRRTFTDNVHSQSAMLPSDEAYLSSRSSMHSTGASEEDSDASGYSKFGSRSMVFYDNYRRDQLGMRILKLSRYSHLAIRYPGLKNVISHLIDLPDNAFNRMIWFVTEGALNIRVHAAAPWSYFVKYFLFHREKQVR
jgi:radical SAM superfamily enzyme YgiQ (UPF0313 family)